MTRPLEEHYASQDTEELLDIARKDLTEEARSILNDVLAGRGITSDVANAAREDAVRHNAADLDAENRLASPWVRFLALTIDVLGVAIVLGLLLWPLTLISIGLYETAVIVIFWTYFLFRDALPGQSLGKRMLNIRVVRVDTGRSCNWSRSLWRNLTHFFFWIDALFAWGRRRMRLGDMIAGTVVVRGPPKDARA